MLRLSSYLIASALAFGALGQMLFNNVPDSLTDGARQLILHDTTIFRVVSINESYLERKYKVVMLSDPLNDGYDIYLAQNDYRNVEHAKVEVKSALGEKIDSYKLKDFNDVSTKGFSIADDSRILYQHVTHNSFPYSIEVSYKVSYTGSMFYPVWDPQSEFVGVKSSVFIVEAQNPGDFRHKSFNTTPQKSQDGKRITWNVSNLPPIRYEYYSRNSEDYGPVVYTAPNKFQMDNIEGDMSSWGSFGDWIVSLNEGKDDIGPDVLQEVLNQIPDGASDLEKTKIVYNYLQKNTRYVSIQLGIGGWQPFNASFVHEKKFGDCKALSYYTKTLLAEVGVPSFYTLINAGKYASKTDPDFPMSKFNHAILTVPIESDTVWLECTSQTNPFGYLGTFISDRDALLISDGNSKIIHTKTYSLDESSEVTKYDINFGEEGSTSVSMEKAYSGLMIEKNRFDDVALKSKKEQVDWFVDTNDWSSIELDSIKIISPSNEGVPKGRLEARFQLRNAFRKGGKRLFFSLKNFLDSDELIVDKEVVKNYPFEMRYNLSRTDSLVIQLPNGYHVENSTKPIEYNSDFGSVKMNFQYVDNQMVVVRELNVLKGKFNPSKYEAFQKFVMTVKKTESKQLVLVNKT
ncbi:DUF3858 domain-containing protein [Ekhidna sp.]